MVTNERFMPVAPEAVWDVLADPGSYGYWVVWSKEIRDAEPSWPAAGTKVLQGPPCLERKPLP